MLRRGAPLLVEWLKKAVGSSGGGAQAYGLPWTMQGKITKLGGGGQHRYFIAPVKGVGTT